MIYNTELYYFFDTPGFPFEKAFLITAQTASQWCDSYMVELIEPKRGIKREKRTGAFSGHKDKDWETVSGLFAWVNENAQSLDLFSFWMYPGNKKPEKKSALFDHHDDTCCWVLDITEDQFAQLQKAWKKAGLPEDLFFPADQWKHIVPKEHRNAFGMITGTDGMVYTPKQWENRKP